MATSHIKKGPRSLARSAFRERETTLMATSHIILLKMQVNDTSLKERVEGEGCGQH